MEASSMSLSSLCPSAFVLTMLTMLLMVISFEPNVPYTRPFLIIASALCLIAAWGEQDKYFEKHTIKEWRRK